MLVTQRTVDLMEMMAIVKKLGILKQFVSVQDSEAAVEKIIILQRRRQKEHVAVIIFDIESDLEGNMVDKFRQLTLEKNLIEIPKLVKIGSKLALKQNNIS